MNTLHSAYTEGPVNGEVVPAARRFMYALPSEWRGSTMTMGTGA